MAADRTADEVHDEYIRLMGTELGQLHHELCNDLAWLHVKWKQYRELFGTDKNRIALLNSAAPLFFAFLQKTLFEDVLLHLTRLTDPPRSMGRDNLTVRRIPELIGDATLKSRVDTLLKQVLASCKFARERRNRTLAHADLLTRRAQHPVPLPPASRQSVEQALGALRELLNELEGHYRASEVAYEYTSGLGGADFLVHYLAKGLEAEAAERRRLRGQ